MWEIPYIAVFWSGFDRGDLIDLACIPFVHVIIDSFLVFVVEVQIFLQSRLEGI
jgi:hypothetical protein